MSQPQSISLILSTYNWKEALERVLISALKQTRPFNEILIADDGSREDTKSLINKIIDQHPNQKILHIWHEDKGFRLSKIRNRAIAASSSDYIASIDGDMILHPKFSLDHLKAAKRNHFVQGGRVILGPELTASILSSNDNPQIGLLTSDIGNRKNALHVPMLTSLLLRKNENHLKNIRGCNQAFWRDDLIKVNGFDEQYEGWGREDTDICIRLLNSGVNRQNLKFAGIAYHLFHNEADRSSLDQNDATLERSIREKIIKCETGLDQYL